MQGSKLYVGNLSFSTKAEELITLFSTHGEVKQANVIEGKGFGFVEMSNQSEAETAKKKLDGYDLNGRQIRVDVARPPKSKPRRRESRY